MRHFWIVSLMLLVLACGKNGDNSSNDGQSGGDTGGTIDDNPKDVSGTFYLGDKDTPAVGAELILSNWTDKVLTYFPIKEDGSVKIELGNFAEAKLYSFHLVLGEDKLGDLDLSSSLSGLQSAFQYKGGYGFSFGDVIVSEDDHGVIEVDDAGIPASIGGGFNINTDSDALLLQDVSGPDFTQSIRMEPSLLVSSASDLYYGYLDPASDSLSDEINERYAGFSIQVESTGEDAVVRSFVSRSPSWLSAAKVIASEFSAASDFTPWRDSSFYLTHSGSLDTADVVTGLRFTNKILYLKIEGQEAPQYEIPRLVTFSYGRPPYVKAVAEDGGAVAAIDFTDGTQRNGLTNPFCHTNGSSFTMTVANPLDQNRSAILGSYLGQIELRFSYYAQESGLTYEVDPTSALSSPFDDDFSDDTDSSYPYEWVASTKTLRYTLASTALTAESHAVTLPSTLLPAVYAGKSIAFVKVELLYKSESHPGKSGSVFWIKIDC